MPDIPDRNPETPAERKERAYMTQIARYSEIGFIIPAAVFLGWVLGYLLDRWLGTHWIYIAGVIFGAVVGFVQMIRSALRASK